MYAVCYATSATSFQTHFVKYVTSNTARQARHLQHIKLDTSHQARLTGTSRQAQHVKKVPSRMTRQKRHVKNFTSSTSRQTRQARHVTSIQVSIYLCIYHKYTACFLQIIFSYFVIITSIAAARQVTSGLVIGWFYLKVVIKAAWNTSEITNIYKLQFLVWSIMTCHVMARDEAARHTTSCKLIDVKTVEFMYLEKVNFWPLINFFFRKKKYYHECSRGAKIAPCPNNGIKLGTIKFYFRIFCTFSSKINIFRRLAGDSSL
jgi:hypothetical protein